MWKLLTILVSTALCSLTTADADQFYATRNKTLHPGYIWACRQEPLDIAFVVDASNSIWNANFTLGLKFIHDFLSRYDIGENKVRVAAVLFSGGVFPDESFGFTDNSNKPDVLKSILSLPYVGGYRTDTGLGIRYMRRVLMEEARPDVPHIGIVVTDGQSHDKKLTALEAALARSKGIMMFAIGIGMHVSFQELINIAGNPDNAFNVQNYDALQAIKDKLEYRTCVEKLGPTPPPPPPCGKRNPSNVMFIFDVTSLNQHAMEAVRSFMSEVIHHVDMEFGMQYGVSSGQCPDDAGVNLGQYENPDVLIDRISGSQNKMLPLLKQANVMFGNGRSDASQYAVVFYENEVNVDEALDQFKTAFSKSVQVSMVVVVDGESSPLHSVLDNVWLGSGEDLSVLGKQFVEQLCTEAEADAKAKPES